MGWPEFPSSIARSLFESARRLRRALRALDLDAAAVASEECRRGVEELARLRPATLLERRWARAAERMLGSCHRQVRAAQTRTGGELELLRRTERGAAHYGASGRGFRGAS